MRMSKMLMPTLKEIPSDAEITSHQLMLSWYDKKNGIRNLQPITNGYKSLQKSRRYNKRRNEL